MGAHGPVSPIALSWKIKFLYIKKKEIEDNNFNNSTNLERLHTEDTKHAWFDQ